MRNLVRAIGLFRPLADQGDLPSQVGQAVTQRPGTLQASVVAEQVPHERGWQAPQQQAPVLPRLQVPKKLRVPLQLRLQALAPPGAQESLEFFFSAAGLKANKRSKTIVNAAYSSGAKPRSARPCRHML